jgi:hypothetical protein
MDTAEPQDLIHEASLALRALRLRHEAARYEAEAIELEAILERAKGGDRGELERWLARQRMSMGTQAGHQPPGQMRRCRMSIRAIQRDLKRKLLLAAAPNPATRTLSHIPNRQLL